MKMVLNFLEIKTENSVIRSLYLRPKILILDEITSALDENTAKELLNSLNKLLGKITILYTLIMKM